MADQRWDDAPCGLVALGDDGTVVEANATLLRWLARSGDDVVGSVRLSDLFSVGGRIYWETHLGPLLAVDRRFDEVALELKTPYGRLPVLVSAAESVSAGRVEVAICRSSERSRYERELQAARTVAERSASQSRALQHATAALSRALGVEGVAVALLSSAVSTLGARAATLWLAEPDGGLGAAMSRGEPSGSQRPPRILDVIRQRAATASDGRVHVPLHGQSTLQGVLSLAPSTDAGAEGLDLEVLTAVGQQAGLAIDRAQLYEQSANVAHELQQSLLAIKMPNDPRYAVAAVYRPGVERLEVGGDWYDVFLADDGVLAFGVGDVVGRGLTAASAMGQLRSAVRAVAGPGASPSGLLSRLDRFVEHSEAAAMATVAYAELDLASGDVTFSCAGHPPPLLMPGHGEPRLLWDGRSTPLGAFTTPQLRPQARVSLSEGDRLLLYTDGLVERRERALDVGLDLLRDAAADVRELPLDAAVRHLTRTMLHDERTRDDVCLLLLSWVGRHFERHLSANLSTLSAVRRALGGWLTEHGLDELVVRDLVLATSEALANAAEHGSGGRADEFVRVEAEVVRAGDALDEVVVTVHDRGHWRTGQPSAERGRGLRIIEALVDEVSIDRASGAHPGTTVVLRRTLKEVSP